MAVPMPVTPMLLNIDEDRALEALRELAQKLDGAHCEVVLDFSSVQRVDSSVIDALADLARIANKNDKATKLVLRNVNVNVYKVLKLVKLTGRFTFVS
jgi:anti-anti-sigma regulatory factor